MAPVLPATTTAAPVEPNYTSPGYRVLMVEMKCSTKYGTLNCDSLGFEEMPQATTIPEDVEFADFRNNRLSSLCGGIFYGGENVKALYFANNQIFHLEPNTFSNLSSITHLDLSHNYLVHIPVEAFNGMLQLNTIDLGYNKIMYLSRDVFLQTKGPFFLKELRLNHNELRELDHDLFQHLFHMDALDLEDNVLEDLPDAIFVRNPRLRDLKLSMNHFKYVPTNALRSAKVSRHPGSVIEPLQGDRLSRLRSSHQPDPAAHFARPFAGEDQRSRLPGPREPATTDDRVQPQTQRYS